VLSRLQWPGYTATGASLVDPTDGYLVTVAVPAGAAGQQVTVSFSPPGWGLELVTLGAAALLALGWVVVAAVRRRRSTSSVTPAAEPTEPTGPTGRSDDASARGDRSRSAGRDGDTPQEADAGETEPGRSVGAEL
jgi:hypothetical protein